MNNVQAGFDTRKWNDNDLDSVETMLYMRGCQGTGGSQETVRMKLVKTRAGPDDTIGFRTFACRVDDQRSWGVLPSGEYHYVVDRINTCDDSCGRRLDVEYLRADY